MGSLLPITYHPLPITFRDFMLYALSLLHNGRRTTDKPGEVETTDNKHLHDLAVTLGLNFL
jgi:hypothetical protein